MFQKLVDPSKISCRLCFTLLLIITLTETVASSVIDRFNYNFAYLKQRFQVSLWAAPAPSLLPNICHSVGFSCNFFLNKLLPPILYVFVNYIYSEAKHFHRKKESISSELNTQLYTSSGSLR